MQSLNAESQFEFGHANSITIDSRLNNNFLRYGKNDHTRKRNTLLTALLAAELDSPILLFYNHHHHKSNEIWHAKIEF